MRYPVVTGIVIVCTFVSCDCARILAVFPFQAKSHYNVYEPLLKRLSERGHEIVAVTHFPQRTARPNFTDIDISSSLPSLVGSLSLSEFVHFTRWKNIKYLTKYAGVEICDPILNQPGFHEMLRTGREFDVYIVEIFGTECFLGVAQALKIPTVVGAITSVTLPWANEILRNPENPSYIPNWFSGYTDRMNLLERSVNAVGLLITKLAYRILSDWPSYKIAKRHFGDDLPDFDALRSRMSLVLTNGHTAISTARPLAPGFKEVGGIHIPASGPQPLPKDLQDYLDSHGRDGVIYFSLGSQIDSSTMPLQVLAALYGAFEQVPQQILWKCSEGKMPPLPKNVKCIEWAPQLSVLCHPNVRLFITHAGLLGTQEAVYCGVPILGMPLFGDQYLNVAYFEKRGLALQLDFRRLSYERILNSLNELLTNKSYTEMAGKASLQFRDRAVPPLEEAVYWIEYLIRHGPESLRTAAADLPWYQFLLLDVILAVTLTVLLIAWSIYKLLRLLVQPRERRIDVQKKRR